MGLRTVPRTVEIRNKVVERHKLEKETKYLVRIIKCLRMKKGITAVYTMTEWGQLQSFEKLRDKLGLDEHEQYRY